MALFSWDAWRRRCRGNAAVFFRKPHSDAVGLDYPNRFEKNRASRDVIQLFVRLCLVTDITLKPHSNNTF